MLAIMKPRTPPSISTTVITVARDPCALPPNSVIKPVIPKERKAKEPGTKVTVSVLSLASPLTDPFGLMELPLHTLNPAIPVSTPMSRANKTFLHPYCATAVAAIRPAPAQIATGV